ncbi:hypothetical protein RchiOBHm_Chr1g0356001 [Rosa chinensis]|uniref:Uncharacterized protein n=1 Tax=Rosa chinensis TaxID=74649 RepID=A0A2P6SHI2_ROSCH|nr:hypothetical protein RchiOBHm_Chr1g0356001 [Rosa chinensis]
MVLVPASAICYFPLTPSNPDNEVNHSNLRSRHLLVQLHLLPIFIPLSAHLIRRSDPKL